MQYHFRVIKNDMYQLTNHNIGIIEWRLRKVATSGIPEYGATKLFLILV